MTRAALERAEEKVLEEARPPRDNVVALANRRRQAFPGRAAELSDRYNPAVPHTRSTPIEEVAR